MLLLMIPTTYVTVSSLMLLILHGHNPIVFSVILRIVSFPDFWTKRMSQNSLLSSFL